MAKRRKKHRKSVDRKNWTPSDPCLRCSSNGPHLVEFSHEVKTGRYKGKHFKASCADCGAYQKFLSEEMALPYVVSEPVWMLQDLTVAPF